MYLLTETSGQELAAEYLLTVHVAKQIADGNSYIGELTVHMEQSTSAFATNCFPLYQTVPTLNSIRGRLVRREKRKTKRNGRIDVAVMTGDAPVCAIEVKRLNPGKRLIRKDLERNAEYFGFVNQLGQRSNIEFTVFETLHKYKTKYERHRKRDEQKALRLYTEYAKKVRLPPGVACRVSHCPVQMREQLANNDGSQEYEEPYLYVGISIVFFWEDQADDLSA